MKALIASIFALTLLGATAANAGIGAGARIVGASITISMGNGHHHYRHHYRHCTSWGWSHRHHERYCRRWGW
jgi:hypothetical protein